MTKILCICMNIDVCIFCEGVSGRDLNVCPLWLTRAGFCPIMVEEEILGQMESQHCSLLIHTPTRTHTHTRTKRQIQMQILKMEYFLAKLYMQNINLNAQQRISWIRWIFNSTKGEGSTSTALYCFVLLYDAVQCSAVQCKCSTRAVDELARETWAGRHQ